MANNCCVYRSYLSIYNIEMELVLTFWGCYIESEYKKSTVSCVHHEYNCRFVFFYRKIIQMIAVFIPKVKNCSGQAFL